MTPLLGEPTGSGSAARLRAPDLATELVVIDGVFDPATCRALIEEADSDRWLSTTADILRTARRPSGAPPHRVTEPEQPCRLVAVDDRPRFALVDDPLLALRLFYRLAKALPPTREGSELAGIKPLLRCFRFRRGEGTLPHCEPVRETSDGQRSQLSVLVFLNDDFVGGGVEFPSVGRSVSARAGRALVFPHGALRVDQVVERSRKFVLAAEVFYAPDWRPYAP